MHIENLIILFVYTLAHLWYNRNTYYEGKMGDIMDTLAKDFFVEDFIGDREDVLLKHRTAANGIRQFRKSAYR